MSSHVPGWYDNPEAPGLGQRYWDGARWTSQYRRSPGSQGSRPNEKAYVFALLFGVLAYVGLLVVLNPALSGDSFYGAGRLLVPAGLAVVVVGLLARRSSRLLGWWVYAAVLPVAAVLGVVFSAGDLKASMASEKSPRAEVAMLTPPAAGHGWTVVDTPQTRADVLRVVGGMKSKTGQDAVAGYYVHRSAPNTAVLFVGVNGNLGSGVSASQGMTEFLAGASVKNPQAFEPGDTGGALGCGRASTQASTWVSCAWVGNDRTVLVRWDDEAVALDRAAELARELRDRSLN